MPRSTKLCFTIATAALVAVQTACPDVTPFNPCPEEKAIKDVGQMDTRWDLAEVNDSPLPVVNPDPQTPNQTLTRATIDFHTETAERGSSCSDVKKSAGAALITVTLVTNGQLGFKRATAHFTRDHTTGETSLTALDYSVPLIRNGTVFTATSTQVVSGKTKSVAFIFGPGYTLQFERIIGPGGFGSGN